MCDPSSIIILNFNSFKILPNFSRSLKIVKSQLMNLILFDLYLNLKFLSIPYIFAFGK